MGTEKKEAFLQSQDGDSKDVIVKIEKMYIDVVNQVFLMALFARELTSVEEQCRIFFKNLKDIHIALQSPEALSHRLILDQKLIPNWLKNFYVEDVRFEETKNSVKGIAEDYNHNREEFFQEQLERIYEYGVQGNRHVKEEKNVTYRILLDLLAYYDGDDKLFTDKYRRFLDKLSGSIVGKGVVKHLGGYGHRNIFLILFFFTEIMKGLFEGKKKLDSFFGEKKKRLDPNALEALSKMIKEMIGDLHFNQIDFEKDKDNFIARVNTLDPISHYKFELELSPEYAQIIATANNGHSSNQLIERYLDVVSSVIKEKVFKVTNITSPFSESGRRILLEAEQYHDKSKRYRAFILQKKYIDIHSYYAFLVSCKSARVYKKLILSCKTNNRYKRNLAPQKLSIPKRDKAKPLSHQKTKRHQTLVLSSKSLKHYKKFVQNCKSPEKRKKPNQNSKSTKRYQMLALHHKPSRRYPADLITALRSVKTYFVAIQAWDEVNLLEENRKPVGEENMNRWSNHLKKIDNAEKSSGYPGIGRICRQKITKQMDSHYYSELQNNMYMHYKHEAGARQTGRYFSYPLFF